MSTNKNELQNKLDAILQDKNTNLLPENIKSGVTCLGVEGTLVSGDFGSITAVPADVKKGKKFIDTTGVLRKGTFPDISYNSSSMMSSYSVVKSDLEYYTTSINYYRNVNLTKQFNGLIYNSFNGKLEVKNSNDVLVELELAEKPYVMSVGCKDVFGENSVLIACTYSDRIDFYIHNYVDNTLGSFGTINASDYDMQSDSEGNFYPVCFLSPYYDFISISWGIYDNTNESFCWVCKLKPNLAFDKIQKLFGNTYSNSGSFLSFAYWVSKDLIYKGYCSLSSSEDYLTLIPNSSMSYLYNNGVSSSVIDSSIISVDIDQKYCITNPDDNLKNYILRKLVIGSSTVELGDIIKTFTITNRISTKQTVIQGDLIVSADYINSNFTSKFYKLDRNTNSVTEISELIPNCEPEFLGGNLMFFNYRSQEFFYILVETIQSITSMSYDNKLFINTSDANATANDIVEDKTAYVNGEKITGTMPNNGDVTIAPTTSEQVKEKGYYNSLKVSAVTSAIDSNITPENIKKDVSILGVTGTLESGGSSDYNAKLVPTNRSITNYITEISENLDTSNVDDMYGMFQNCTNLTTIPQLDTSNVDDMNSMFEGCTNLTTIPQLDTSNVTDMGSMFEGCTNLTTIPQLDTSKVTDMIYMFQRCTSLTEIPQLNTSNVTDMSNMFYYCTNLITIPELDTSSVRELHSMFINCPNLSDESLNNILQMCINATSYTDTKTLAYIGLAPVQANKCKTLSNYSAFTSAGWKA